MDYIEGSHIITYRVYHKNGFVHQESLTVGCRVGYDEAYRYIQDYWGYDYEDRIEILSIEPTERAIIEHQMRLNREREMEEREKRRECDPEVYRYRMMQGEGWEERESGQEQDKNAPNPSDSSSYASKTTNAKTGIISNHSSQKDSSESKKSNGWWSSKKDKGWW